MPVGDRGSLVRKSMAVTADRRPGVPHSMSFTLGPVDPTVVGVGFSVSSNGGHTWRAAKLTRLDHNSFRVGFANPAALGARTHVSLRLSATDASGRHVTETAIRAYRLRP